MLIIIERTENVNGFWQGNLGKAKIESVLSKRTVKEMTTLKRILKVLLGLLIIIFIGYFIYTGFQV